MYISRMIIALIDFWIFVRLDLAPFRRPTSKIKSIHHRFILLEQSQTASSCIMTDKLIIRRPDDFHHHCRDGSATASVLIHAVPRFTRCLMMPNLKPPVTTTDMAVDYKKRILGSMPADAPNTTFQPVMTLYLTDKTTPEEIRKAYSLKNQDGITPTVIACKYYPAGATTNSEFGVKDFKNLYPVLGAMQEVGMMLCIHSEVVHADIFEREPVFIEEIMKPLVRDFPTLKITMEHISTLEAVNYVLSAPPHVKATITPHHLIYNRNSKFTVAVFFDILGGVSYCMYLLVHRFVGRRHQAPFVLSTDSKKGNPSCRPGASGNEWQPQVLFGNGFCPSHDRFERIGVRVCGRLFRPLLHRTVCRSL